MGCLTQNPDRTFKGGGKPNCSQFGTGLIAYDFELSFSFVRLFALNASAWEVCSNGFYNKHIFHSQLKEGLKYGKVSFESVIDDLRILDIEKLMKVKDILPAGWLIYALKIESHLQNVIQNLPSFEKELIRSLA